MYAILFFSYKNNALKLASVYRDRPQEPLDTAVYWTEFVLRHNGTPFMQSAAVHQPWYENLLLDVIAAFAILLVVIFKVLLFIARRITVYLSNVLYNNNKVKKNV
uniref:UDP-glucuronosyltransferase n=1 Tax=Clastoptera arizonana TaxID=38151 RepID=A0A1B6DW90_9HEMI